MITVNKANPTAAEERTSLVNASDGSGLHFDGSAGYIDIASPPDLGTKFSFEFVIKADSWGGNFYIADFGNGGRFLFFADSTNNDNLAIYDTDYRDFGVAVLDDLKVHHLVVTVDGTAATLYDNGNQVGTTTLGATPDIDDCSDAKIGSNYTGNGRFIEGTIYRARFYNRTLSADDVRTAFERADIDYSSQYGSQTNKISGAVDKNWGTNQADTGNDANDRATFNTNYVWGVNGAITDISVASNVLQFTTSSANEGVWYPSILTGGKKYRVTIRTGTITGDSFKVMQFDGSSLNDIGTLVASTTNVFDFTADSTTNGNLLIYGTGSGTLQLNAASVDNEVVQIGCVSDYDLAFANPTQSLTVQDRAGAADGTASSSGVTQVQPVVQLNSTSARIGTSAATPADGTVKVGDALTLSGPTTYGYVEGGSNGLILANNSGNDCRILVNDDNTMQFNTSSATRLTIDSTGNITTASDGIALKLDGSSNTTRGIFIRNTGGSAHGYLHTDGNLKIIAEDSGKSINFYTADDGTGTARLSIASTGLATFSDGINLGDTTLSNYAEGSFTPTISAENGTINGTNQEGRYTRVGNVCHVWFTLECTGVSGASGAVNFGSLPFTSASSDVGYQTPMVVRYLSLGSAVESVVLRLFNNSTGGRIEEQTGTSAANLADNVQNGTVFQVAGSYRI